MDELDGICGLVGGTGQKDNPCLPPKHTKYLALSEIEYLWITKKTKSE